MMEWWMKLLPLFCVILLSLGWWGDLSVPTYIFFFWSRQKSDTNMKKNSAWPWIRRIRCVSSFHRCKSWIISDVKLKNRSLIILDNLCSNSKRFWGFFCFWKTFIIRKSSLIHCQMFLFLIRNSGWFWRTNSITWKILNRQMLCCGKPWIYKEYEPLVSKLRNPMNAGQ